MLEKSTCPKCDKKLMGAIEITTTNNGTYSFIVQKETSDCNWVKCIGCEQVMCKKCYADRPRYCCSEGRIVDHERARAALALNFLPNSQITHQ